MTAAPHDGARGDKRKSYAENHPDPWERENIASWDGQPMVEPDPPRRLCDPDPAEQTYGMCTACGSIEVALVEVTGTRDFSHIGESADYPTGYGCEVCA